MSQQGARGRAAAGQTFDQILGFYYTGVTLTTIDGARPIKVRLGDSFVPTPTMPARVTGYIGGWQSTTFPGVEFPQGSYVEMWPSTDPSLTSLPAEWVATVYDASGVVLATATTSDLVVEASDTSAGVLYMAFRDELPKYKTYRGAIRMIVTSTGLQTINILPLESYLRGVVPAEVPASWPIEAVKAQAVAARTYAWAKMRNDRNWDILPTAAHQVYGGYQHEHWASDRAVSETANLVLTYGGKIISALYHAAAGGHTENSEYAFVNDYGSLGSKVAYLRGKADVDENGVPYDATAGSYAWQTGQFTMSELSAIMRHSSLTYVGDLHRLTFWRGVSGRVYKVLLEGSEGSKYVSGGKFKNLFNVFRPPGGSVKSTLFYLTPVAEQPAE
jgi:SpoIID/LytB domain protein